MDMMMQSLGASGVGRKLTRNQVRLPYIHTYMHTYIRSYIHTCTHTCIHTYISLHYISVHSQRRSARDVMHKSEALRVAVFMTTTRGIRAF